MIDDTQTDLFQREIYFLKDNGFVRLKPKHERVEFDVHFADKNLVESLK